MIYFITGANRGIGLELVRDLASNRNNVWAAHRQSELPGSLAQLQAQHPDHVHPIRLDVTMIDQIQAAAAQVREQSGQIDVLINNAGIFPRGETPENLDEQTLLKTLQINAIGPLSVAREMLPLLEAGPAGKIVNLSSQLGSLERKTSGGNYSYCSSKAALNMLSKALAADLRSRGITVIVVHPGWVQTDMGGPGASLTPTQSVKGLVAVINRTSLTDTGKFYTWDGRIHPW